METDLSNGNHHETWRQFHLQEQLLNNDREANPTLNDHVWDSDLFINPSVEDCSA
jgi:hypothetical protein